MTLSIYVASGSCVVSRMPLGADKGHKGIIVPVWPEEKIVMAIADVDQWCHLKVNRHFRLVDIACYELLARSHVGRRG